MCSQILYVLIVCLASAHSASLHTFWGWSALHIRFKKFTHCDPKGGDYCFLWWYGLVRFLLRCCFSTLYTILNRIVVLNTMCAVFFSDLDRLEEIRDNSARICAFIIYRTRSKVRYVRRWWCWKWLAVIYIFIYAKTLDINEKHFKRQS